ncbi:MAG: helix-turn-helix domain-containing protein [Candidatus Altiarchaeota archaeon]
MLTEKENAAKNIAGEITLANNAAESMRKWREVFGIKQTELSKRLKVSPSVISDYESGRRQSPGTHFVKRFVETLINIDEEKGGQIIGKFTVPPQSEAMVELREFETPIKASKFIKLIDGEVIANKKILNNRELRGYTIIDSIQAILNLSDRDFRTIYGSSTERALIFTKVKMGRSPMIAVKVTQPKPGVMILHGLSPNRVDMLARRIAERENIPLVVSKLKTERELIERLRGSLK